jgi:hypothetical protein
MAAKQIFTNQTVDGDSETFSLNGNTRLKVSGNLGGGTISILSKSDNPNDTFSTTGTEDNITAVGEFEIKAKQRWNYKLNLSGSTGASVNAFVSD